MVSLMSVDSKCQVSCWVKLSALHNSTRKIVPYLANSSSYFSSSVGDISESSLWLIRVFREMVSPAPVT